MEAVEKTRPFPPRVTSTWCTPKPSGPCFSSDSRRAVSSHVDDCGRRFSSVAPPNPAFGTVSFVV